MERIKGKVLGRWDWGNWILFAKDGTFYYKKHPLPLNLTSCSWNFNSKSTAIRYFLLESCIWHSKLILLVLGSGCIGGISSVMAQQVWYSRLLSCLCQIQLKLSNWILQQLFSICGLYKKLMIWWWWKNFSEKCGRRIFCWFFLIGKKCGTNIDFFARRLSIWVSWCNFFKIPLQSRGWSTWELAVNLLGRDEMLLESY